MIPFKVFIEQGKVRKNTPDPKEARSLLNRSKQRLEYISIKEINSKTAPFVLEDSYESVRESAQSLMSLNGFKPYSHKATVSFINEYYSSEFSLEVWEFDRLRKLRNNSVYTAAPVSKQDAIQSLSFAKRFVEKAEIILVDF